MKNKQIEKEIEYIKDQREEIKFRFDKYVQNYHHSMMWLMTSALGLIAIVISLGENYYISTISKAFMAISTYRLIMLGVTFRKMKKISNNFNNSIDGRYEKIGINIRSMKKELGIK